MHELCLLLVTIIHTHVQMREVSLAEPNYTFAKFFVYLLYHLLLLDEWTGLNQQVPEALENKRQFG